jgi:hypothetical protein
MSIDKKDVLLLWACNISGGELKLHPKTSTGKLKLGLTNAPKGPVPKGTKISASYQKSQYVSGHSENRKPIKEKGIVVNRVTGCGAKAQIRAAIVDINKPYYTENHVNLIKSTPNAKMTLEELHVKLTSKDTSKILKYISGNTQLSKKELLNLIPISLDK